MTDLREALTKLAEEREGDVETFRRASEEMERKGYYATNIHGAWASAEVHAKALRALLAADERRQQPTSEAPSPSVIARGEGSDAGCDGIRARVLALLERNKAGTHENWRDSDPGYWIGVAEGEAAVERELEIERAKSEANQMAYRSYRRERDEAWEVLRDLEWAVAICGPNDTWDCCPECNEAEQVGHAEDCRLDAVLCAADPKRLSR